MKNAVDCILSAHLYQSGVESYHDMSYRAKRVQNSASFDEAQLRYVLGSLFRSTVQYSKIKHFCGTSQRFSLHRLVPFISSVQAGLQFGNMPLAGEICPLFQPYGMEVCIA